MHGRVPIEAAAECGIQLAWETDIGVGVHDVNEVIGVMTADRIDRELDE